MAMTTSNSIKVKPLLSALGADGWTYEQSFMSRCGFAGSQDGLCLPIPAQITTRLCAAQQVPVGNNLFTIRWRWLKRLHANGKLQNTQAPTSAVTLLVPELVLLESRRGRTASSRSLVIRGWCFPRERLGCARRSCVLRARRNSPRSWLQLSRPVGIFSSLVGA